MSAPIVREGQLAGSLPPHALVQSVIVTFPEPYDRQQLLEVAHPHYDDAAEWRLRVVDIAQRSVQCVCHILLHHRAFVVDDQVNALEERAAFRCQVTCCSVIAGNREMECRMGCSSPCQQHRSQRTGGNTYDRARHRSAICCQAVGKDCLPASS